LSGGVLADPLLAAIEGSGLLGITTKQIAAATGLPVKEATLRLDQLARTGSVTRMGRGLWVLERFHSDPQKGPDFLGPRLYSKRFERDCGISIGLREGPIQFSPNEERPVHRWWPYVQGFSASFVEEVLRRYRIGPGATVLDPFCGSGTVPVVARLRGAQGIGTDRMPIASWVSRAKGLWEVDPTALWVQALQVSRDRSPSLLAPPFLRETASQFSPPVLEGLLRLKENLGKQEAGPVKELLRLAFASILIPVSRLKRSPCLGYARGTPETPPDPFARFLEAAARIREDLEWVQSKRGDWGPPLEIQDMGAAELPLPEGSVDLAVTSPPYVNGMDYVMNYKIDLAWMDLVSSYEDLRRLRSALVACDNVPRKETAGRKASPVIEREEWLREIGERIDLNLQGKPGYRRLDVRAIVEKYFDDLLGVIRNVQRGLRPGGRFVVVNGDSLLAGTYIPGDLLFARLARSEGFRVEGLEIARSRRSGQRRDFLLRETVLTLQKPIRG
jgi:DNA modification methylase